MGTGVAGGLQARCLGLGAGEQQEALVIPGAAEITLAATGWHVLVLLLLTVPPRGVDVAASVVSPVNALRH
jgi:hypothetical protein